MAAFDFKPAVRTPRPLPPAERLHELFSLDPATGVLTWRHRAGMLPRIAKRFVGQPAGHVSRRGYVQVCVDGVLYLAHRVVWKMVHGTEPPEIDHANGRRDDNRPANLREATHGQNLLNRARKATKALPKGVHRTAADTFKAEISVGGDRRRLGTFSTPEAAHAAYRAAAADMHGAFARFD